MTPLNLEWVINDNVSFDYSLCHDNVISPTELLTSYHMPIPSSMKACAYVEDSHGATFIVPPTKKNQLPITFGRVQTRIYIPGNSEEELPPPQFYHYSRTSRKIMERMGYNLRQGDDLNFGKGHRIPLQPFVPKGKPQNYYDRTCRRLGYVTPPEQSKPEDESLSITQPQSSSSSG